MPAISALNLMFRHNIRHLPLVRGRELAGMVSTADLLRLQTQGVGHVVQDLLDAPGTDAETDPKPLDAEEPTDD